MKKIWVYALMACLLTGCRQTGMSSVSSENDKTSIDDSSPSSSAEKDSFKVTYQSEDYTQDGSAEIYLGDKGRLISVHLDGHTNEFSYSSSNSSVLTVDKDGNLSALSEGDATISITSFRKTIKLAFHVLPKASTSTENISYMNASMEEKANIVSSMEKYAMNNYLTGITIGNGKKVAFNKRVKFLSDKSIDGYDFDNIKDLSLDEPLANAMSGKTTYYNICSDSIPASANVMKSSGSDVSTVSSYISNTYFSKRMNQNCDGYEWYPSLSTDDRPIAVEEPTVNVDGTVKTPGATISETDARYNNNRRWRIHLRSGVKYRTGSTLEFTKKYDKTEVKLEDYVTPLKFMFTAWNSQDHGAELTTGVSGFVGALNYYVMTSENNTDDTTAIWDEEVWNQYMGSNIYTGTDESGDFIEFNLLENCTQFYAMYYLSSSLYSPLPESFIKFWGGKYLGQSPNASSVPAAGRACTPCDTMLSTGPYYIESWDTTNGLILFKKNDEYFYTEDVFTNALGTTTRKVYNLDGIAYNKVEDSSTLKSKFLDGQFDSYSPKAEDLKTGGDFSADEGESTRGIKWKIYKIKTESNYRLDVNSMTEERYLERFGSENNNNIYRSKLKKDLNGNTPKTACKPYMSNIHFLNFLSFSINRKEICEARGSTPTQEYFSDNYLIDPESGVSYNSTAAHKAVLADRYNDTYGFNETYAKEELRKAFEQVIIPLGEAGAFSSQHPGADAGTSSNPYIVPINMLWTNLTDHYEYSDLFDYVKKIFSDVSHEEFNAGYELQINEYNLRIDEINKRNGGTYDLSFDTVDSDILTKDNYLEAMKSDANDAVNYGVDTSVVGSGFSGNGYTADTVVYDGKEWSFDALYEAFTGIAMIKDGVNLKVKNVSSNHTEDNVYYEEINDKDKSVTYKFDIADIINSGAKNMTITCYNEVSEKTYTLNQLVDDNAQASSMNIVIGSDFEPDIYHGYYSVKIQFDYDFDYVDSSDHSINTAHKTQTFNLKNHHGISRNM